MKKRTKGLIFSLVFLMALFVGIFAINASAESTELDYYGIYINVPAMEGEGKLSISDISIRTADLNGNVTNDADKYVDFYAPDASGEALWKKGDYLTGTAMNGTEVYQIGTKYYVTIGIKIKDEYL